METKVRSRFVTEASANNQNVCEMLEEIFAAGQGPGRQDGAKGSQVEAGAGAERALQTRHRAENRQGCDSSSIYWIPNCFK